MNTKRFMLVLGGILLACALVSTSLQVEAQTGRLKKGSSSLPPDATRCDISLPITVEMVPLNEPQVGQAARFEVLVNSRIDPDLGEEIRVEYELPERVRFAPGISSAPALLARSGRSRLELGAVVPDQARYPIRARVIVQLTNGKTVSQTAVRWIDLGSEDPPEGMIKRIVDPDGTGIRVYQGRTVK
jgi:hypothetical protein